MKRILIFCILGLILIALYFKCSGPALNKEGWMSSDGESFHIVSAVQPETYLTVFKNGKVGYYSPADVFMQKFCQSYTWKFVKNYNNGTTVIPNAIVSQQKSEAFPTGPIPGGAFPNLVLSRNQEGVVIQGADFPQNQDANGFSQNLIYDKDSGAIWSLQLGVPGALYNNHGMFTSSTVYLSDFDPSDQGFLWKLVPAKC